MSEKTLIWINRPFEDADLCYNGKIPLSDVLSIYRDELDRAKTLAKQRGQSPLPPMTFRNFIE